MNIKKPSHSIWVKQAIETDLTGFGNNLLVLVRRVLFLVIYFGFIASVFLAYLAKQALARLMRDGGPLVIKSSDIVRKSLGKLRGSAQNNHVVKACLAIGGGCLLLLPFNKVSSLFLMFVILSCAGIVYLGLNYTPWSILYYMNKKFVRFIYQLHVEGMDNIPAQGGAIVISNHISFVDFSVLSAIASRPLFFVMDYGIYQRPLVRWFVDIGSAIPIDSYKNPNIKEAAFRQIQKVLGHGDIVAFFPEGQVSYDGHMIAFRKGLVRIQEENDAPIIPVTITGLEGGFFSRVGRLFNTRKLPHELFRHVTVRIGKPIPAKQRSLGEIETLVRSMLKETMERHSNYLAETIDQKIAQ